MGMKGTDIIKLDIQALINELNKAIADEWLAYYQYWVSAKIATGKMRPEAVKEFTEHADDELRHADMLAERTIQLGGQPVTNPGDFDKLANCAYLNPTDPKIASLLKLGIEGERCAIEAYNNLLAITKDKDVITYNMVLEILSDEIDHEADFMTLLEDLQ